MEQITSRQNEIIKRYRRLRDSSRERYAERLFVVEGYKLCLEALHDAAGISELLCVPDGTSTQQELISGAEVCRGIDPALAQYISDTSSPQGVFGICRMPEPRDFAPCAGGRYLLLEHMQDPGNVGTAIRTAEAMGVDGVLLSPDSADIWSPKTLRSAMGSIFRLPLFARCDIISALDALEHAGIACYAAALHSAAEDIRDISFEHGGALIIGNEGAGISEALLQRCGRCVIIPMAGGTESMNAAAAAAIALWELSGRYLPKAGGGL